MPTIVAPATPPGTGGIGILRLSGPGAKALLGRVFLPQSPKFTNFRPWVLHHGVLLNSHDSPLDEVLAVYMPGPRTYTGEDTAEIHCHGGEVVMREAMESFLRLGARLAEPGEFTRRAFLNGRLDLSQAEAVAEMINARTEAAVAHGLGRLEGRLGREVTTLQENVDELRALAKLAVDFPDDEIDGLAPQEFYARVERIVGSIDTLLKGAERASLESQGATVVLCGPVNVGKSSLLNTLYGSDRALVTDVPGTTRDFIEISLNMGGLPVRFVDTAGLRENPDNVVEALGIEKSLAKATEADLALLVLDASAPVPAQSPFVSLSSLCILVWNKIDAAPAPPLPQWASQIPAIGVSALTGENLEQLLALIRATLLTNAGDVAPEGHVPPNNRQACALRKAREELLALLHNLSILPHDCCLSHLDQAAFHLGSILTLAADDELLNRIFSNFCIGK